MEKKVLAAVDGSLHSRRAIEYAGRMASMIPDLRLTLFHVQPGISQFLLEEARRRPKAGAALKQVLAKNAAAARQLLEKSRELAVRAGVPEAAVELVTLPRREGAAKDILDFAENGLFDALLIGRRGLSALQELFSGSVSANLCQNSRLVPVWLVDGEVRSQRILTAVDGSENSLKAIDHLAFMLSGSPRAEVAFLHVTPRLRDFCEIDLSLEHDARLETLVAEGDARCMDRFFAAALKKLAAAGIPRERLDVRTVAAVRNVGKAILAAAREGGFGTVVLGRRGINRSFFSGSVSNHVAQKLSKAAAWIIP
jgi:nucleotide-binding universal stress UspA family protein